MRFPALVLCIAALLAGCGDGEQEVTPFDGPVSLELQAHTEEFTPEIIKVTDGVYVAVGFALANSILIEGEDGVIVVDTTESARAAEEILTEFRRITGKPVKAVIYTHNHADHVFGARVFTGGRESVPVYAHESTEDHVDRVMTLPGAAARHRSRRMFGTQLPPGTVENNGIGPFLRFEGAHMAYVRPTKTVGDRLELTIAGVKLELVHAPGESEDQIFVWLPEKKVLLPGDNFYRAFPNIYSLRGTASRDARKWVASLDKMRALKPEFLVPSHTRPISGAAKVMEALTHYRDAIQFVHDQTVRAMNRGMTPDEAVAFVKLPDHLANYPWLRPYYGRVEWSVRAVYAFYLGWFSGDAAKLDPLPPEERARRYKKALEMGASLETQAEAALADGEYQWAAELATHLIRAGDEKEGKRIKAAALQALGERTVNANGRNYYLTQAAELRGDIAPPPPDGASLPAAFLAGVPIADIMTALPVRLRAENALTMERTAEFRFPDLGETWTVRIRRGVAEVTPGGTEEPNIVFSMLSDVWKDIVFRKVTFAKALKGGEVEIEGPKAEAIEFLRLFKEE